MGKMYTLELILDECKQDPDLVFKIQIFRIRTRPKMDRIRNKQKNNFNHLPIVGKKKISVMFVTFKPSRHNVRF